MEVVSLTENLYHVKIFQGVRFVLGKNVPG